MTKARREIAESMRDQDVILEVLDARMPRSSENPLIASLRRGKLCIKVLTRSDLADPQVTDAWLRHYETRANEPTEARPEGTVLAVALRTDRLAETRKVIPELCARIVGPRTTKRSIHAMIVGIPNVGKSTLMNTLSGRKVANASDKPAVTKKQQFVVLPSGLALRDNPGILWPKLEDERKGLCLALAGAIPESAADPLMVAMFAAETLMQSHPEALRTRYKIDALPETAELVLETIGRKRGKLRPGGIVDMAAASAELIHAFRSGALGPISLESPPVG